MKFSRKSHCNILYPGYAHQCLLAKKTRTRLKTNRFLFFHQNIIMNSSSKQRRTNVHVTKSCVHERKGPNMCLNIWRIKPYNRYLTITTM